jgi:transposase
VFNAARESNPDILRLACLAYEKANGQLVEKVRQLTQRLAELAGIEAAQIGLDLPEVVLFEAETHTAAQAPVAPPPPVQQPRKPRTGHGPTLQPDLPREMIHHSFDQSPECSLCGGEMQQIPELFEESEEITVAEATFRVAVHRRQKYRCRCNGSVATAPGPEKLIPGGRYSVDFAVHSAIAKFCDHLPLERQVRQAARQGLVITSQTLWDQQAALAEHLEPSWKALCVQALAAPVLHVDETGWRMMGQKKKWSLFGLTSPHVAAYHLASSKSAITARELLKGFQGTLVVDGFAVYPLIAKLEESIRVAHCWAHADRKFKEAKDPPEGIAEIRSLIAKLYEIEREVEGGFPGNEAAQQARQVLRTEKSKPIIETIREWAFSQGGLRRSDFGKAVRYMLKHWNGLMLFLEDPRIPLDNNAAERALRGPVVGRKNFYGNRSQRGAQVAAILYSLIETAKLQGVNPSEYLRRAALAAIRNPGSVVLPS